MRKRTIAIDFDGVLHEYTDYAVPLGKPVKDAVDVWYKLYNAGYTLVVYTCREDIQEIKDWLHHHFDFDRRLGPFYEPIVTNLKPLADVYIDDRAIRFTNWDDIRKYFC